MREMLITSSVLILALLLLRFLFRSTISRRTQYALWLLVALRLLIPVSIGSSGWSVAAMSDQLPEREISESILTVVGGDAPDLAPREPDPSLPEAEQRELYQAYQKEWKDEVDRSKMETGGIPITVQSILYIVWYIGMAVMALWFLAANLRFARSLRRTRVPLNGAASKYPVYLCDDVPSPCLFGLFRPAIYVTSAAAKDENRLRCVIAHEETHARHLDPLWSLVRSVCLAVWWFDPLVWLAAYCSRADCELACDEGTLARLGEAERVPYGETLLALVPVRRGGNPMLAATTMTAGKRQMKERIQRIAEHKRPLAIALAAALALTGIVCAVTFTGAEPTPTTEEEALDALEASVTVRSNSHGVNCIAFTLPEYERSRGWDIHIAGRAVYPDGTSRSVHEYELFPDASHWEAGREYTIQTDSLTELTLHAALTGQDGRSYAREINLLSPIEENGSVRPTEAELEQYGIVYDEASMTELYTYQMDRLLMYVLGAEGAYAQAADEALYEIWNEATDHDAPSIYLEQGIDALTPERAAHIRERIAAIRSRYATPFANIMGLDGWYEEYQTGPHHSTRRYYISASDGRSTEIGKSFHFDLDDYVVDLDGDGMTELICNCGYEADGVMRLHVYRRNGDMIERGSMDYGKLNLTAWDNRGVNSTAERFDPASGKITVEYASLASSSGDGSTPGTFIREVRYKDLVWEEYANISG